MVQRTRHALDPAKHGDLQKWEMALAGLPAINASLVKLGVDAPVIGSESDRTPEQGLVLRDQLMKLHPWRKGPYRLFGLHIDTEWRSDFKWQRLKNHIAPLNGRLVLDVGCGNGYHCWRMAGDGAKFVLGIDPGLLYFTQFRAIQRYAEGWPLQMLPLALEDIPEGLWPLFDSVFSMGVLYHRKSPLDHLMRLGELLKPGGELILETLVVDGDKTKLLIPDNRYARMRNVWFLPSCEMLLVWLKRCGFVQSRVVDVNNTSCDEQRSTEWMRFESLRESLDRNDSRLTVEGLPAPKRAIIIALKPS